MRALWRAAQQELGIETTEKEVAYYEKMFGHESMQPDILKIFLGRVMGFFPVFPEKMEPFGNYQLTPHIATLCANERVNYIRYNYLPENAGKQNSDRAADDINNGERDTASGADVRTSAPATKDRTVSPKKFLISENPFIYDTLQWEWQADGIRFHMLETSFGYVLSIAPKEFDAQKGIRNDALADLLLHVVNLPYRDNKEVISLFQLPPILYEGMFFSNINDLTKITAHDVSEVDISRVLPDPWLLDKWSDQIVGIISKEAICLIITRVYILANNASPLHVFGNPRWLSGRIFENDEITPVLPKGVREIPKSWEPVLEKSARDVENNRIEAAKWKLWYDKSGQLLDEQKMKFDHRDQFGQVYFNYASGSWRSISMNVFGEEDQQFFKDSPIVRIKVTVRAYGEVVVPMETQDEDADDIE